MNRRNTRPDLVMRSGQMIWFLDPRPSDVRMDDLTYYLPRIKRYNGGSDWSLAQHLVLCAEMYLDLCSMTGAKASQYIAACLAAHDIHEVIVGDMTSGLKKHCPQYKVIEDSWMAATFDSVGLKVPQGADHQVMDIWDKQAILPETQMFMPAIYDYLNKRGSFATWHQTETIRKVATYTDAECLERIFYYIEQGKEQNV